MNAPSDCRRPEGSLLTEEETEALRVVVSCPSHQGQQRSPIY